MIEKLALISVLTSLATEGVKKILKDKNIEYSANILAASISLVITIGLQIYTILSQGGSLGNSELSETIALILLSFLTATVGYDKVLQTFKQLKG